MIDEEREGFWIQREADEAELVSGESIASGGETKGKNTRNERAFLSG